MNARTICLLIALVLPAGLAHAADTFTRYGWTDADGGVREDATYVTVRNLCGRPVDVRVCPGDRDDCGGNRNVRPWSTRKPGFEDAYGLMPDFTAFAQQSRQPFKVWLRTAFQSKQPEGPWHVVREIEPGTSAALDVQADCKSMKPRPKGRAWGCYEWAYAGACPKHGTTTGPTPEIECAPPPSVEGDPSNLVCEAQTETGTCRARYQKLASSCLTRGNADGSMGGEWALRVRAGSCAHDLELDYDTARPGWHNSMRITTGTDNTVRGKDAPLTLTLKSHGHAIERWDVPRGDHGFTMKADCSGLAPDPAIAGVQPPKKVPVASTRR